MSYKLSYTGQQVQSYLDKVATGQAGGGTKDYNTLEHIPVINQDLSGEGFLPIINTYYRHTGETTGLFTQGMIYLYTEATYTPLDGEVPTKISQLTNDIGYTKNKGTVTSVAVQMNGDVKGRVTGSGTIDLGTVLTAHQDISGKQDKITSSNKLDASLVSGLATVATSGSYNDLSYKPTIPTKTSQLTNDSGYATTSQIPDVSGKANLSGGNEFVDGGNTFKDIGGTTQISGSSVWLRAVGAQGSASLVVETDNKNEVFKVEADSDNGIIHINRAISIEGDTGTSGKVLTSQGSGNAPAWTTLPTFSLSGTTLTLTL